MIDLPVLQAGRPEVLSARRWDEQIRWVHVSDVADLSALLQGGELVFTTGAALRKSPERYLGGLAAAGALGVVVELAAGVPLAQSVKRLAEQLDLALVALRREIKFVEVTEEVHRRIVSEQFEEVAFDRRVHETFTDLSMKRVSAIGIVEADRPDARRAGGVGRPCASGCRNSPGSGYDGGTSRRLGATLPARLSRTR